MGEADYGRDFVEGADRVPLRRVVADSWIRGDGAHVLEHSMRTNHSLYARLREQDTEEMCQIVGTGQNRRGGLPDIPRRIRRGWS